MMKRTPYQVAAYIRAVVKREVGKIETDSRKYSEEYSWYTNDGKLKKAWRYKYYIINPSKANMERAYEAYKLINSMAARVEHLFGYEVNCHFLNGSTSLVFNVTPIKSKKKNMIKKTNLSASGTSFHGNTVNATYNELVKCFGAPHDMYIDKSTAQWTFKHSDGFVFTLYDWKEMNFSFEKYIAWHIGAMDADQSHKAFLAVCDALEDVDDDRCVECSCGCDELPVEVEDEGPEFDSAGFSKEDRTETKVERFNVNDRVIISNSGKLYDTFWPMRKAWNFDCGDNDLGSFSAENGDVGVIVKRGYHYDSGKEIYGVRMDNGDEIIIGHDGVDKAPIDQLDLLIDRLSMQSYVFSIDAIREAADIIRKQYPNL